MNGKKIAFTVRSLISKQLELICYQYFSDHRKYDGLLLRIGGSLRALDIFGFKQGGEKIHIQVTQESNRHKILNKIFALKVIAGDEMRNLKLIFCGHANKIEPDPEWNRTVDNVEYIALEEIDEWISTHPKSILHEMLDRMIYPSRY